MSELENANAHDSGDCLIGCPHPDHVYDGDFDDLDLDVVLELRLAAFRADRGQEIADYDDLDWDDEEGPVEL